MWVAVLVVSATVLISLPESESIAIEVVVLAFALLYGFGMWPVVPTVASVAAFVVLAAVVMVPRAASGDLPPAELVELAVPFAFGGAVIYHVRRREEAVRRANELALVDRRRAAARERLSRMTSHEMRTPLTIAAGYVDHLLLDERDDGRREELLTVRDEIEQLTRVTDRLVRAVALDLGAPDARTAVGPLLEDVARRWRLVAERDLVVECGAVDAAIDAPRLRAALDTLVENSVRYTLAGQRIRLFAEQHPDGVVIGVADAGPGLSAQLTDQVNAGVDSAIDSTTDDDGADARLRDVYSQTGFGLRIVASIAQSAGGRLLASAAPEGGAQLVIDLRRVGGRRGGTDRTTTDTEAVWETAPETPVTTTT